MRERKTYIINIDGMRADYFGSEGHQGCLTPTLLKLAKEGVQFKNCKTVMPSNTGTNHTAILTSAHAGSHGILGVGGCYKGLDKRPFRFSRKYGTIMTGMYKHHHLQMPTFFNVVKQNNPDAVTSFIPGKTWLGDIIADEDCDATIFPLNKKENWGEYQPEHGENPDYVTDSEGYVLGGQAHPEDNEIFPRYYIPTEEEIGKEPPATVSPGFLGVYSTSLPGDKWIIDQAINCVNHDNPDFMYIILMNMDMAGHFYGSFLPDEKPDETDGKNLSVVRNPYATKDQLHITDQEINRFISHLKKKKLYKDARIVIISDHGMNTTKSMLSGISRKRMFYWILDRLGVVKWDEIYSSFRLPELKEELDLDIRQILKKNGIFMRASQGRWFSRYNPQGDYDWCYSDGGIVGYIYNADTPIQRKIKSILEDYAIKENGKTKHPFWKILIEEDMGNEINEFTNFPFRLGRGDFSHNYDVMWPSVIIFPDPHYMIPLYNDQLYAGLMPLMIDIRVQGFTLRISGGLHGTYLEQDVPLIFVSPNEAEVPSGAVREKQVTVLDIAQTINKLNGWPKQPTFEGKSLFS